jgi:predicted phosphodiesterase
MRLAILSDIHGNLSALEAVLADLKQAGGADKTWVLGDLCTFGPRPVECLQMIREIPEVQVIGGNTDRYLVRGVVPAVRPKDEAEWQQASAKLRQTAENFAWTISKLSFADYEYLTKLHHGLDLNIPGYGWAIGYHGSPGNDEYILLPDTPHEEVLDQFLDQGGRLGFGGHTHIPMDRDLGQWRVINVGSVGLPKDEPRACYALATFNDDSVIIEHRRVEFDRDAVLVDLRQQNHPAVDWVEKQLLTS